MATINEIQNEIIEEFAEEKTSEMLLRLTTKSFFRRSFDRRIFAEEANSLLRENMDLCRALSSNPDYYFFWRGVEDTVVRHLINCRVDSDRAGRRLSHRRDIEHFVFFDPFEFIDELALEQRNDDITSAEGKGAEV